ncbi:MAG: hypothetical protein ACRC2T_00945, partial [Thermoguttaceae bacterium]
MKPTLFQQSIAAWQFGVVLDSLVLLLFVSLIWLAIRRFASPQWGIALFLLVVFKAAFPVSVYAPATITQLMPSTVFERFYTLGRADVLSSAEIDSPAEDTPQNEDEPKAGFDSKTKRDSQTEQVSKNGVDSIRTENVASVQETEQNYTGNQQITGQEFHADSFFDSNSAGHGVTQLPTWQDNESDVKPDEIVNVIFTEYEKSPLETAVSPILTVSDQQPSGNLLSTQTAESRNSFLLGLVSESWATLLLTAWGTVVLFLILREIVSQVRFRRLFKKAILV